VHYDGVHVQITDRNSIGKEFVNDRPFDRTNVAFASDHSPAHFHHNWRFVDQAKTN
jgi:hypothetical protein